MKRWKKRIVIEIFSSYDLLSYQISLQDLLRLIFSAKLPPFTQKLDAQAGFLFQIQTSSFLFACNSK